MQVAGSSIGNVWHQLLKHVYEDGGTTTDDGVELTEALDVHVELQYPVTDLEEDEFLQQYMNDEDVRWMLANFHSQEPIEGWGYSYGSRFRDFEGHDQLKYVRDKLSSKPTSKSATVTSMYPPGDQQHVPCISTLDFKLRDGLMMTAFFRSQDIGKKSYADLIALKRLQDELAHDLDVENNKMRLHIVSAHIYETDYGRVEDILY